MAVITQITASGSELNTPWAEVTPVQAGGTLQGRIAYALGYRTGSGNKFLYRLEVSPGSITLNEGTTSAAVYMFSAERGTLYTFDLVTSQTFSDYDETAQDAALSTNLTLSIGGTNYSVAEADTGVTFDSDVITVDGNMLFALRFQDSRDAPNDVLQQIFDQLEVT